MDVEKGSKVGSDRKVRDSMIVREERLGCDINDDDDINVIEDSRQVLPLDKEYDYLTPGWKLSSATTLPSLNKIITRMGVTRSPGLGQEEVSSLSKEEKRQKKGKQENEKEKGKEKRISQSNKIHNRTGVSGMTSPVDAALVDVMEDVQHDTTTPQDKLQAELNRAIYERDALVKASLMRERLHH
ncbi:unnamed protein product [Zymoseptoria tritici ST99CH_3D1]|nr:unnamed protein product [Zymoseptoria tritici ST99CH_3D1]